ncbi:acyl carrier protein [Agarilytica rhodophyticola]|uniref:acyl carrier protein n=1 Tax=Agarilytica rhodophyticola TaxID=1737490 RepID=UPI000B3470AB|nr:phosphopantetheine-binding protein [Agarilytica rhodophyticola]
MDKREILDILKNIIVDKLDLNLKFKDIDDKASLLDDGLSLDSISMAEFVELVESEFSIQILDDDLDTDTFGSLEGVCYLVQRMLESIKEEA